MPEVGFETLFEIFEGSCQSQKVKRVLKTITSDILMADGATGESVRESMKGRIRWMNLIEWPRKRLRKWQDNGSWEQAIERNIDVGEEMRGVGRSNWREGLMVK
jgi:hypothetical protein